MSRTRVGLLILSVVAMLLHCVDEPARTKVKLMGGDKKSVHLHTSLCEVASNPAAFYDKNIVIYGCILTDGKERVALIDKACPHTGISLGESDKLNPEQRNVLESIGRKDARQLCGMFSGTFRASTKVGNIVIDTNVLEVSGVETTTGSR